MQTQGGGALDCAGNWSTPSKCTSSSSLEGACGSLSRLARPDFWFRNAPLMRNADIVEDDELTDWNFLHVSGLQTDLQGFHLKPRTGSMAL